MFVSTLAGFTRDFQELTTMQPTHRVSHGRSRRRRSHQAMTAPEPTMCPLSGMPKMHHRPCKESGYVRPGLKISVPKHGIGVDKD
jgi:large subunit ribosomal protein L32